MTPQPEPIERFFYCNDCGNITTVVVEEDIPGFTTTCDACGSTNNHEVGI